MKQVVKRLKREDEHVLYVKEKDKTRVIRLFRRLNAERCEYCGTGEGTFEVHHVRKLKDVAHGKEQWQQLMAARHRKTLILCKQCHQKLHAGTLPDRDYLQKKRKGRAGYLETRTS